jgi:hypothetical protein
VLLTSLTGTVVILAVADSQLCCRQDGYAEARAGVVCERDKGAGWRVRVAGRVVFGVSRSSKFWARHGQFAKDTASAPAAQHSTGTHAHSLKSVTRALIPHPPPPLPEAGQPSVPDNTYAPSLFFVL